MSTFNPDDPRITAYVLGELDPDDLAQFESELANSHALQIAVEEVRETVGGLEAAFAAEEAQQPVVSARSHSSENKLADSRLARRRWVLGSIAAVLVIGVVASMAIPLFPHVKTFSRLSKNVAVESRNATGPQSSGLELAGDSTKMQVSSLESATEPNESPRSKEEIESDSSGGAHKWTMVESASSGKEVKYIWQESSASETDLPAVQDELAPETRSWTVEPDTMFANVRPLDALASNDKLISTVEDGAEPLSQTDSLMMMEAPRILIEEEQETLGEVRGELTSNQYFEHIPTDAFGAQTASSSEIRELAKNFSNNEIREMEFRRGSDLSIVVAGESRGRGTTAFRAAASVELARRQRDLFTQTLADHADGRGPGHGGDKFEPIHENDFLEVKNAPLSTFSIDVDTASYSKTRQFLMDANSLPRPDSVRIEELLNYFSYDYEEPKTDDPFWANTEVAACPWGPKHRLVRVGLQGKTYPKEERPPTNLVFLLDVSGSMDQPNKLPLLRRSMKLLVEQLGENDRVAITVYAGAAGKVLESTTADNQDEILGALDRLHAGGSTNGGAGIHLAYQTALDNFIKGGVNRVILCTDGDFNVGTTGTDELVRLAEKNAKTGVFLSVFGFGMGNHNDSMLEQVSNKGNGNYGFIDNDREAKKSFVEQMTGTLITIAKDVKIQVEFNPQQVSAYRLIGYENRILAARDFNDDTKDAGEIGAGHTVTALYEIVPVGTKSDAQSKITPVDDLKYQKKLAPTEDASSGELLTLKLRYKQPDGDTSKLLTFPVKDSERSYAQSSQDYRFAASVASFGMLLRNSQHKGSATWDSVLELATEGTRDSEDVYRAEFIEMIKKAKSLSGE